MIKNKYSIILGVVLTYLSVEHAYIRRGSLEFGGEYIFIFLPFITNSIKDIWIDSKEMAKETIEEIKSW